MNNVTADEYLTLAAIDALIEERPIRVPRMTYCGVQVMGGVALLLMNDAQGSTKCLVAYDEDEPVFILEEA